MQVSELQPLHGVPDTSLNGMSTLQQIQALLNERIFEDAFHYKDWRGYSFSIDYDMPGVGLMVKMVGLGSKDSEFKCHFAVELIPGGVDSACHPSEVGKISTSLLVPCVGVVTRPGLYPTAKETA